MTQLEQTVSVQLPKKFLTGLAAILIAIAGLFFSLIQSNLNQSFQSLSQSIEHIDEQQDTLAVEVAENNKIVDERFKTVDSNADDVDDKVADVVAEVDSSRAVAVVISDHVNAEVVEVKTEVEKISTSLTEASTDLDNLKIALAIAFPDKKTLTNLTDKRASIEQPIEFFDEDPKSAALTTPPGDTWEPQNQPTEKATRSIANHCRSAGANVITCYQQYLDKLAD